MTGYTVHTGSTEKFSNGWDNIFKKKTAAKATAKPAEKANAAAKGKATKKK
jgi:hypothetical protein